MTASPRRLLFLCTGNYYRSRFAELLFNALAREAGLSWIASSRGIATAWNEIAAAQDESRGSKPGPAAIAQWSRALTRNTSHLASPKSACWPMRRR